MSSGGFAENTAPPASSFGVRFFCFRSHSAVSFLFRHNRQKVTMSLRAGFARQAEMGGGGSAIKCTFGTECTNIGKYTHFNVQARVAHVRTYDIHTVSDNCSRNNPLAVFRLPNLQVCLALTSLVMALCHRYHPDNNAPSIRLVGTSFCT